jgi:hypothetical protein
MISHFRSNLRKLFRLQKQFSTLQKAESAGGVVKRDRLQFSKARLTDFGELPQGEIPEALKFDRAFSNLQTIFIQRKVFLIIIFIK